MGGGGQDINASIFCKKKKIFFLKKGNELKKYQNETLMF